MPEITLDEILTHDRDPVGPPYRISDKAGFDTVVLRFTITSVSVTRAWRVTLDGDRANGRRLASAGVVCGLDRCGPEARSLALAGVAEFTTVIDYAATGPAVDGDHDVNVFAIDDEGWA